MKTLARIFTLIVCCSCSAQPVAQPAFDAASIRASDQSGNEDPHIQTSPGSLTIHGMSLRFCIQWAYGLQPSQLSGPAWLKDVGFDIVAKAAQPVGDETLRLMLRTLLTQRFGLKVHTAQKELQLYALTVVTGGPKFQESATQGPPSHAREKGGAMAVQRTSMAELAQELSGPLNRPVIDATGLKGRYDFRIDTLPYVEAVATSNGIKEDQLGELDLTSILMTALKEQLGLKLEPRKDKADILVVDQAERVPTEN
jgi:uncharacterized protein (TIGR03435 family)